MVSGIEVTSRLFVSAILLLSFISKCFNFQWFVNALKHYQLIPNKAARFVGVVVVLTEAIVGICLLAGPFTAFAAYGAMFLFLSFSIATTISLLRGKTNVDCGCNGFRKKAKIGWQLVARNLGLLGFTVLSLRAAFIVAAPTLLSVFLSSLVLVSLSLIPELQLVKTDS